MILPRGEQPALHVFDVEEVLEYELVLGQSSHADDQSQWPAHFVLGLQRVNPYNKTYSSQSV